MPHPLVSILAGFLLAVPAPGTPELDLPRLRERWQTAMETFHVAGAAVAVVRDGEILALEGLGVRDPEGRPVGPDTMFYIASATKPYVAAAVVALADEGRLDLDAPVREAWPAFTLADEQAAARVTVRDLLCHRAGLDSEPIVFLDAYTGDIDDERYLHWLARVEPLGRVEYTNLHYTLLGRVIEAVTGTDWKTHLETALFRPLGLDRTTASATRLYGDEDVALPMTDAPDGGFAACRIRKTDRVMHAAGGLGTSARDAARWLLANMPGGALEEVGLLSAGARAEMQRLQAEVPPRGQIRRHLGYGLGWHVGTYRGRPYLVHDGDYVGAGVHTSLLPEHGIGVAVLTNATTGRPLCDIVSIDVYDALLGESGHEDLLPHYEGRAARVTFPVATPPAALPPRSLSRAPEAYVGRYEHPDWGSVHVSLAADGLRARIGDLPLDFDAEGRDAFRLTAPGGGTEFTGSFPEGPTVDAILLRHDAVDLRFTRAE